MKMMASKKKHQPSSSDKNARHPSGTHLLTAAPPPVPPRPLLAALKLPRKSPLKDHHAPKPIPLNQKFLRIGPPSGGIYFSNSCDNVHQLSRQPYLNEVAVYGSSHIILGQHIHAAGGGGPKTGSSKKNGPFHLKSSASVKLPSKPNFVGSHPDINSYQYYARSPWGPENYVEYTDRRTYVERKAFAKETCLDRKFVAKENHVDRIAFMKENCVDRNCRMKENYIDRKLVKDRQDRSNYVYVNGYDYYDPRCYNDSYHHKNTLPVPCYPSRKVYSTNSSSSSKSSSKSKSSSNYSNHEHNSSSVANYTFNKCTFRADSSSSKNKQTIYVSSEPKSAASVSSSSSSAKRSSNSHSHSQSVTNHSDYSPISDFSKLFPLSAKMTSLHGLPPLPKSLSSVNLQNSSSVVPSATDLSNGGGTLMDHRNGGGGPSMLGTESKGIRNEERRGRSLPTPPASLSQGNVAPLNYAPSANRKPVSLDAKLTLLREEMFGLRQLDLSLLSQLWSLNESIQEFRQLQESIAVPSPSDDGEDTDEMLYSNLAPVSNRRYRKMSSRNGDDSSSSSSSVDFGKV